MNREFWNERYASVGSVYGNQPNEFLRDQLSLLKPGKILLPAEGEGRNALYAARLGWDVYAFDYSEEARNKSFQRAKALNLTINYTIEDISQVQLPEKLYDAIALIYVHIQNPVREQFLAQCIKALKPGGSLIMEVFSTNQLKYTSGGPKDFHLLYSLNDLKKVFDGLHISIAREEIIDLNEGAFHQGAASVVRLVATK